MSIGYVMIAYKVRAMIAVTGIWPLERYDRVNGGLDKFYWPSEIYMSL